MRRCLPATLTATIIGLALCCSRVAEAQFAKSAAIYAVNLDGTGLECLIEREKWFFSSPSYSHDMRSIICMGWQGNSLTSSIAWARADVFIFDMGSAQLTSVAAGRSPSWSPRNGLLALYDSQRGLVVSGPRGGAEVMALGRGSPAWHPHKNILATHRFGDDIELIDLESGERSSMLTSGMWIPYGGFSWSPDGKEICFVGRKARLSRSMQLAVVDTRGESKGIRTLITDNSLAGSVAWSPDGQWIACSRRADARVSSQLQLVAADGDGRTQRIEQPVDRDNVNPSWSPDGKRLLFASFAHGSAVDRIELQENDSFVLPSH